MAASILNSQNWQQPSDEQLGLLPNAEERTALFSRLTHVYRCSMVDAIYQYNHLGIDELRALVESQETRDQSDTSQGSATRAAAEALVPITVERNILIASIASLLRLNFEWVQVQHAKSSIENLQAAKREAQNARLAADIAENEERQERIRQRDRALQTERLERLQRESAALRAKLIAEGLIREPQPIPKPGERKMRLDD